MTQGIYRSLFKRILDLLIAVPALLVLSPVAILVWTCVRFALGRPAIFRQTRLGLNHVPFTLYKFRSMTNATTADGALIPDDQRLTPFGQFLRSTSLDEIPQLWNVIRGHMSLIGPRPLLPEYLEHYSEEQKQRHLVRPGITGWAQIHGRNDVSWDDRLQRDVWYVRNGGLLLDLKILFLTIGTLTSRRGVARCGSVTMPRFDQEKLAKRPVLVLGGGGHAKVVVSTLQAAGHDVELVLDDDSRKWGQSVLGVPIRGPISDAARWPELPAVIAIGDNEVRRMIAQYFCREWISVIHPAAYVHKSVQLGEGTIVAAGAIVQPDAVLGEHVIVNSSASIDHDCIIEDFSHVGPGAVLGGNVLLRSGAFLGCGVNVIPGICVGPESTVGAGAVVIRDIPNNSIAVGVPANVIGSTLKTSGLVCGVTGTSVEIGLQGDSILSTDASIAAVYSKLQHRVEEEVEAGIH